jgi:hypothetical protein
MMNTNTVVSEIKDARLTPTMERTRNGSQQLFREKAKQCDRAFTTKGNACAVIEPPERHLYSELIDGKWHWVNGCAECNGNPRDWMTYIECDKHDVCRTCTTPRKDVASAWGGKQGWQCGICHDTEYQAAKKAALNRAKDIGHDEYDCLSESEIICPYCATKQSSDDRHESEKGVECHTCGGIFDLEIEYSPSYSTSRVTAPEGFSEEEE